MGKLKKKFTAEQEWSYKHDFPFEEVCGTYHVLAKLIAPRLRCFKALDKHGNAPGFKGIAEWNNGIQKMTDAFELLEDTKALSDEENKKVAGRTYLILQVLPLSMGLIFQWLKMQHCNI